jgi:hypothetical protein
LPAAGVTQPIRHGAEAAPSIEGCPNIHCEDPREPRKPSREGIDEREAREAIRFQRYRR